MIITEYYMTRDDGTILNRSYSDLNFMIERDGVFYIEAIDPTLLNRQYNETDKLIQILPNIKKEEIPFPIFSL